jgi:hypothetical protein
MNAAAVAALRAYARAPAPSENEGDDRCDLCGRPLSDRHDHLVELAARALRCACPGCAALGSTASGRATLRIERRARRLREGLDDAAWAALGIPIGLAYIVRWSQGDEVVAGFPSAGGAATAPLDGAVWASVVQRIPGLADLRPDVEALLVRRLAGAREQWVVSLDLCHELLGHLRRPPGGAGSGAVAAAVERFFAALAEEARD